MTLHGHTRIELTDVHTGAVEVVESDNLVTNAVSDIFNGYGGSLNKAMLLWRGDQGYTNAPKDLVTMFYGGLLLYETGEEQGEAVATLLQKAGLREVRILRDVYGQPLNVLGYAPEKP